MLNESLLSKEYKPIEAYASREIDKWAEIFNKFNRLPLDRKNKFYSNCSRLKNLNDLLSAIKTCLEETYKWEKEDFLAFLANNASDCEIVFNKDNFVIIHVPSFKSSKLLCGNGRTSWCITQQDNYSRQYVTDHPNNDQYFLFDFSRKESDAFAHIGFTMKDGREFYCAQTCNNQSMMSAFEQNGERMSIHDALNKAGVKLSIFLRLNPLNAYKWNFESIVSFIKGHSNDYAIVYEKDGRMVINILNQKAVMTFCGHTIINYNNYKVDSNNKVYAFVDTNLTHKDEKSFLLMSYQKDQYGVLSLKRISNPYNAEVTKDGYLSKIGISRDCYINEEAIKPEILLHKFIDENDEASAIKLIENEGGSFDVNYEFTQRIPLISAINNKMFNLFSEIVAHPKFDSTHEDGFGETLLESLIYLYGSEDIASSKEDENALKKMILSILKSDNYDFNIKDLNSDTAINIACEYPKMAWIVSAFASKKNVDVNILNDLGCTTLAQCIVSKNLEALKIIGQRPDLKVKDEDKKLAAANNINLDDYIKPNENIFGSFKFEGEFEVPNIKVEAKSEFEEILVGV
jgi:hypothetical protein